MKNLKASSSLALSSSIVVLSMCTKNDWAAAYEALPIVSPHPDLDELKHEIEPL